MDIRITDDEAQAVYEALNMAADKLNEAGFFYLEETVYRPLAEMFRPNPDLVKTKNSPSNLRDLQIVYRLALAEYEDVVEEFQGVFHEHHISGVHHRHRDFLTSLAHVQDPAEVLARLNEAYNTTFSQIEGRLVYSSVES